MRLFLSIMLIGSFAFGSGKISLQNNFYNEGKDYKPMIGFAVYEHLFWKMYFNSWSGMGERPLKDKPDEKWFVTKNQIDFKFNRLTVSPGYQYQEILKTSETESFGFLKLDYQLW